MKPRVLNDLIKSTLSVAMEEKRIDFDFGAIFNAEYLEIVESLGTAYVRSMALVRKYEDLKDAHLVD